MKPHLLDMQTQVRFATMKRCVNVWLKKMDVDHSLVKQIIKKECA